jgi:phosphopantetheine--protein transferase-like protein
MITLYIYTTDQVKEVELPKNLDEHCNKYTHSVTKSLSRYSYYLLQGKLAKSGYDPKLITFDAKGKGTHPHISFSLSHSKDYIVIAISEASVGVDVEEIVIDEKLNLAAKILTDEEYEIFDRKLDKNGYLTEKWTLKEAFGKFLGIFLTNSVLMTTVEGFSLNVKGAVVSVYPKQPVKMYYNEREIS